MRGLVYRAASSRHGVAAHPLRLLLFPLIFAVAACSPKAPDPTAPPETAQKAAPVPASGPELEPATVQGVHARVRVVDLEGNPLPGMRPIASAQPNAFDAPVSSGPPTDLEGRSAFDFPGDRVLYVRAWDPLLGWFPNNYYTVMPNTGSVTDEMTVVLAPASRLSARLYGSDGAPLEEVPVRLMLLHPTEGPWWPVETATGAEGALDLPNLPAGEYALHVAVGDQELEVPAVKLPPGKEAALGDLIFP